MLNYQFVNPTHYVQQALDYSQRTQTLMGVMTVQIGFHNQLDILLRNLLTIEVTLAIAERLKQLLRNKDVVIPMTSTDYLVLLPDLYDVAQSELAANKLLKSFKEPLSIKGQTLQLHVLIGVAVAPTHSNHPYQLMMQADKARMIAHRVGEGCRLFHPNDDTIQFRESIEKIIQDVLIQNQLRVAYHPQVNIASRECIGCEALVRWPVDHPMKLSPFELVGICEEFGWIRQLTMSVLTTVLREIPMMREVGINAHISVNISPKLLIDEDLVDEIVQHISIYALKPTDIMIEITESDHQISPEKMLKMFKKFKAAGFQVSLDDFGTGYSSLAYLRQFPVDELKIDQSFVRNMMTNEQDRSLVQSALDMAKNFKLITVAEGVEDFASYKKLSFMGCMIAQGYFLAKPMFLKEWMHWYKHFEVHPINGLILHQLPIR
jgi:predicted signal transduction protein with EAL and GGDEF domain